MINKENFENYLSSLIQQDYIVEKSMNYSLLAKSKRLRPLLLLNLIKDFNVDETIGYPFGSSLEMVHTYSLIHDDLPAFDNDDYRRGKLTNHKAFDEQTAILAGDALLTYSFENLANSFYSDSLKVKLIKLLANYSGKDGMIKGQSLDKEFEGKQVSIDDLLQMDNLKTGKLITVALLGACYIANKEEYLNLLKQRRKLDIIKGFTTKGIHRDDFNIYINDNLVNIYGSQGQHRTAVLSLKMSELQIIKEEIDESPILLLDDFMSELDSKRRRNFLNNIGDTQVIITCTDKFDEDNKDKKIFYVNNGKINN